MLNERMQPTPGGSLEAGLRDEMVRAGRQLLATGLVARTWGNLSCRLDSEWFLVTPSGRDYRALAPVDLVRVRIRDLRHEGELRPSSEVGLHAAYYRRWPTIGAVIHTHQPYASAFSAAAPGTLPLQGTEPPLGSAIAVASYAPSGTDRLTQAALEAASRTSPAAILLRHHGAVCAGASLEESFATAYSLERVLGAMFRDRYEALEGVPFPVQSKEPSPGSEAAPNDLEAPLCKRFARLRIPMRPLLDDFAQLLGEAIPAVDLPPDPDWVDAAETPAVLLDRKGLVILVADPDERAAIAAVAEKNALACYVGAVTGRIRPIPQAEARRLRREYLDWYAARIGEK